MPKSARIRFAVLALLSVLAAACLVGGSTPSRALALDSIPCVGPPADYVAAFDGVRGQPVDGAVTYPYKTVFLEFQGQLTPSSSATVGNTSEHIHEGACIPEGQELNDTNAPTGGRFFDARYIAHNVLNYTVTSAAAQTVTAGGSEDFFTATPAQVAELDAAFQASGGNGTDTVFQSYPLGSGTQNGIKEIRWQVNVARNSPSALVDAWKVSGRSYFTQNYAGKPTGTTLGASGGCQIDYVRTQNWISYHDEAGAVRTSYGYAGFQDSQLIPNCTYPPGFDPTALAQPKTGDWQTVARTTDGTNRLSVIVDPNNHVTPETYAWKLDLGDPQQSGILVDQNYNNPVTVPLSTLNLAGGVHRFMVMGHKWPSTVGIRPISTSITVMPFFVVGDKQAPSAPTSLAKSNAQPSSIDVSWAASTDNVGVAGYRVYLDGTLVADTTSTSVTVGGLSAPSHTVSVEAYDAAGNVSARTPVTITRSWQ